MALIEKLTNIGDAVRTKTGTTDKMTLDEMATAITDIPTGDLPEELLTLTGTQECGCGYTNMSIFIKNFGNQMKTKDISYALDMFFKYKNATIPFEINFNNSTIDCTCMFQNSNIETAPIINGKVGNRSNMFTNCYKLYNIDNLLNDNLIFDLTNSNYNRYYFFNNCYSLRHIPDGLFDKLKYTGTSNYYGTNIYYNLFNYCYALEEIINLPVNTNTTFTSSNTFYNLCPKCGRLKRFTFETNEDGSPKVAKMKSVNLLLYDYVGYNYSANDITGYNSGLTNDTRITDDTTYQALKDNEDSWTTSYAYSRYNHDSAVETINSLPDCSAYLATASGTNYVYFKSNAGSSTDGGAISTLTADEIAVATAKGWTVTLT